MRMLLLEPFRLLFLRDARHLDKLDEKKTESTIVFFTIKMHLLQSFRNFSMSHMTENKDTQCKPEIIVFTDFEYLNEWMEKQWNMHLENPHVSTDETFKRLGGYDGLSKIGTSLVQFGGIKYDLRNKCILEHLSVNIMHDTKTTKFTPSDATYSYAHLMSGVWFNQGSLMSLRDAAAELRKFIADHKWVVMNNDFNVIRHQLPDFASDRKEPIKLKPLLVNTKAEGLNSGKLHSLLTEKEKQATGWNHFVKSIGKEHTGSFDALSMAVYCAVNNVL